MAATNSFSEVSRRVFTGFHEALVKPFIALMRLYSSYSTPQQNVLGKCMKTTGNLACHLDIKIN
jgi:hypothetical protein